MRSAILLGVIAGSSGLLQCSKSKSVAGQTGDGGSLGQGPKVDDLAVSASAGSGGTGGIGGAARTAGADRTAGTGEAGGGPGAACAQFNNGGPCTPTEQR